MTITTYRISKREFAPTMWTRTGAREHGGRWNSKGVAVVYTAENRSLAAMEQLVHLIKPRVLKGFVIASTRFDESQVKRITIRDLPAKWNAAVAPAELRKVGDEWIADGEFPVLAVPSAIVAGEWNYFINPAHAAYDDMPRSAPAPFVYDRRLG